MPENDDIKALQAVVGDLLGRVQQLEAGTASGGSGGSNVPMGLRLGDFQRDLVDIGVPDGTADGQMLIWSASLGRWVPTTPAELFNTPESPPSDGAILEWSESEGKWVGVDTTEQNVVIDVDYDGSSETQQKHPVRVRTTADPTDYETVFTTELCDE